MTANDPNNECDHPDKPREKPYTDKDAGLYITSQGEVIDRCRALLGNKSRLK